MARRLAQAVPTVLLIVVVNFLVLHLTPGDIVDVLLERTDVSDADKRRILEANPKAFFRVPAFAARARFEELFMRVTLDEGEHPARGGGRVAALVRRDDEPGRRPQRVVGGQRLGVRDVERRATDPAVDQRLPQRFPRAIWVDVRAAHRFLDDLIDDLEPQQVVGLELREGEPPLQGLHRLDIHDDTLASNVSAPGTGATGAPARLG